jgi:hypothetical protein
MTSISTRLTELLGIEHPILLAPMDIVADGRLAAAVSQAGGFGIIGGGYGDEAWLTREMDAAGDARVGVGLHPIQAAFSRMIFPRNGAVVKLTCCSIRTKKLRDMRPHVRRAILTRLW